MFTLGQPLNYNHWNILIPLSKFVSIFLKTFLSHVLSFSIERSSVLELTYSYFLSRIWTAFPVVKRCTRGLDGLRLGWLTLCRQRSSHATQEIHLGWHYDNVPSDLYAVLHGSQNNNFQKKIWDMFLIHVSNLDCGLSIEPPKFGWSGSDEYP